jgi:ribose 5-phosphate isomerase RpiB
MDKRVLQISLDIVVGCECDGNDLADEIFTELNMRGFSVVGAGFQDDMTDEYKESFPDLLAD